MLKYVVSSLMKAFDDLLGPNTGRLKFTMGCNGEILTRNEKCVYCYMKVLPLKP